MNDLSESRILIVDDVKANVDVLVAALRDDYKLSVALSGESALRSAEKNPPDLVLLDIMMPGGLDGYEVCRRLRASPQTREVPVMFLSGLGDVTNKAQGFEAGGNDYLTKPFEVLEVKARVHSLLKAKAYADAVKEKLASELRIAREIQLGILPANVSASTRGTGLDVHAHLEPAREVGGDLYEVLRAGDRVIVVVGDVSGKGIPAALFMAVTTTLLRVAARDQERPEEILMRVNDALATHNPRDMFVTLFCAVFQPKTGTVTCANMGHPSPVLLRPGSAPSLPFKPGGLVAGIMPGTAVPSQSLALQPGDTLVFYTDGVTEAFNAEGEQFCESRLVEELAKVAGCSASETVAATLDAVRRHAGEHPQSDDITIVAVRYAP
jgi:sigma-B regulation protein RsbU (phosphoserine phosphatase)